MGGKLPRRSQRMKIDLHSSGTESTYDARTTEASADNQLVNVNRRRRRRYKDFEGDLEKKIEQTKGRVAAAAAENQKLKELETALVHLDDQAAYLSSMLARADLSCSFMPSARVGPHPIHATINFITESAWQGKQPPDEWMNVWSLVPPEFLVSLECNFMQRMEQTVNLWSKSTDPTQRQHFEAAMTIAIRVRSKISQVMVRTAPLLIMEFWKKTLPPSSTEPEGQPARDQLKRLVAGMSWTAKQEETIRMRWNEYCTRMEIIQGHITSGQQALTGIHGGLNQQHRVDEVTCGALEMSRGGVLAEGGLVLTEVEGLQCQARVREAVAEITRDLEDAQVRAVKVYARLSAEVGKAMTWDQFIQLNFGIKKVGKYVVDTVSFCTVFTQLKTER